ncbi:MAG: STAS domain-containing protein [Thermodesulfobacteriota bacterium]|nr:STAS domain-containing protein [Thermodesulfobacteriota bacterium]
MKVENKDGALILAPGTDLVASGIEKMRNSILAHLKEYPDASNIVLDADGIKVVDSLGVNLIIGLYRQADAESKKFEIINANEKFMKVANFFRFPSLFTVKMGEE